MFDSIYVIDEQTAAKFLCAAGHPQRNVELQTKSLECNMDSYYVHEGQLYEYVRREGARAKSVYAVTDAGLTVTETRTFKRYGINRVIVCYSQCYTCDPVVFESEHSFGGRVSERSPRVEFTVSFKDGLLVDVQQHHCETRDEIRAKLLKEGVEVLPDDDRIAKKHIELMRKENARYRSSDDTNFVD
jgi:hypothetical protein